MHRAASGKRRLRLIHPPRHCPVGAWGNRTAAGKVPFVAFGELGGATATSVAPRPLAGSGHCRPPTSAPPLALLAMAPPVLANRPPAKWPVKARTHITTPVAGSRVRTRDSYTGGG
ncbi:hypothetical protein GCM10022402_30720 [Salinactinospora qingdaonensis]|uniref:Uncharacterized protein n=1 Tax=Salinactinospora qingdaonensis TaxID=702744 RepID=A0ABP7G1N8_9ACTN